MESSWESGLGCVCFSLSGSPFVFPIYSVCPSLSWASKAEDASYFSFRCPRPRRKSPEGCQLLVRRPPRLGRREPGTLCPAQLLPDRTIEVESVVNNVWERSDQITPGPSFFPWVI